MKTILFFSIILSLFCAISCVPESEKWQEEGLRPVYVSPDDFSQIYSQAPQASVDQGSTTTAGEYIYINERFKGIHVFDNSSPDDAVKIYFWRIPGNSEFNIDGNFLYADNSRHLITIDISDPANISVLTHIKDVYTVNMENNNYPPNYSGRFECAEFEEGIVVDWERALLDSPRCYIW